MQLEMRFTPFGSTNKTLESNPSPKFKFASTHVSNCPVRLRFLQLDVPLVGGTTTKSPAAVFIGERALVSLQ